MSTGNLSPAAPGTSATPRRTDRPVLAWVVLSMLTLFMVVNFADRTILGLAAQPIMDDLGISASQFGLIGSAFFFLYSISALVVGFIATKVSPRWLLAVIALLWACTQMPVFLYGTVGVLFTTRIVLGAAEGPALPLANSTAFSWFPPEKRGLPSSLISSGASLAKIVVAPLLTLVIVAAGWRVAFLAVGLGTLVWCALWLVVGRTGPYAVAHPSGSGSAGTAPPPGEAAAARSARRLSYRRAVLSRTFVVLLVASFPMFALITVVISWLPAYLEAGLGFTRVQAGFIYGLPSIAAMVFIVVSGGITDRLLVRGGSHRLARGIVPAVALAAGGLLIALLPVLGNRYLSVGVLVLGYGLGQLALPIINAAIGTLAAPTQRASVLGTFLALQSISGVIAPWATGILVDTAPTKVAGYNTAFLVIGALIVAGALVAAFLADPLRDDVAEPA